MKNAYKLIEVIHRFIKGGAVRGNMDQYGRFDLIWMCIESGEFQEEKESMLLPRMKRVNGFSEKNFGVSIFKKEWEWVFGAGWGGYLEDSALRLFTLIHSGVPSWFWEARESSRVRNLHEWLNDKRWPH